MRFATLLLLLLLLLLGGLLAPGAYAQLLVSQPLPPDLGGNAAEACAQAHQHGAQRPAYASPGHRQRMEGYDVSYYKLDLNLTNTSREVSGVVWLKARSRRTLDSLAFELYSSLQIDSVVVDGRRSPGWRRQGLGDVTVGLARPVAANTLFNAFIYYRGTAPNGTAAALGNALNTRTVAPYGTSVTWSVSEPYNAYEWWPCKQVLTDKADSADVWVTTAATNKVGSNGVLTRVTPQPDGRVRYEWKSRYPIAYYLLSVAVAPYVEYVNYANPTGGPRIPIVNYVYSPAALNDFRAEIDRTPGFLEHFSELVGLYPFAGEKYGHSMAPMGGGMEHQTMTTQDGFSFTLTAHELFHQWFGDNVTCGAWEDIWLNEGFASYGEYLALSRFATPADARRWLDQAHASALNQPAGSVFVPDTTSIGRIFNSRLSYKKGAAVVHMLRYLLHDDQKFFRALRTYQTTYAGRTARTRDLQRVFEAEAGGSLQYFFDQWFRGEGYPSFQVRWNQADGRVALQTTESVSAPASTPFFRTEVDYLLTFQDGTTRLVRLLQEQPVTTTSFPETRPVVSITPDPDQWILDGPGTVARDAGLGVDPAAGLPVVAYPNPCTDYLRLANLPGGTLTAEVLDVTGRLVLRQPVTEAAPVLRTAVLAPGLYRLRLMQGGAVVGQARFVRTPG